MSETPGGRFHRIRARATSIPAGMLVLLGLVPLLAAAANADSPVFRCVDDEGAIIFTEDPCDDDAEPVEIREQYRGGDAETGLRESERAFIRERAEREQARRAERESAEDRRRAPGVTRCPSEREIRDAVRARRVVLCMTAEEVEAAEPLKYGDQRVSQRLLESGVMVEEWFYRLRREDWPVFVFFRDGLVIGYETTPR